MNIYYSNEKSLIIKNINQDIKIEYYVPGPTKKEQAINKRKKQVKISSLDDLHLENVKAYTNIEEILPLNKKNMIKVYWKEEDKYLNFQAIDTNNNNLIDKIEWQVPHLSEQTFEISIEILNIQSYPVVGGKWEVKFDTIGTADLTIKATNKTTWSNENENNDLKFIELRCGNKILDYEWKDNGIFIQDYECQEISIESSKVLTSGKHTLEFCFGQECKKAYNDALGWYNSSWNKRKSITINSSKINSNLTDFPFLVDIYDFDLRNYTQSDGDDILFTTSNGKTKLSHEIETFNQTYNTTHAHLVVWIKTNLSSSSNTKIFMYYNNSNIENQENVPEVWDDDYVAVYHMNQLNAIDSTGANNATAHGGTTLNSSGKLGYALNFDGNNGYLDAPDSPSLSFTNNEMTIEAWAKADTLPSDETSIIRKNNQWAMQFYDSDTIRNLVSTDGTDGWTADNDEDYTFSSGTWYYWTAAYDGSVIKHLINAEQVGSTHILIHLNIHL
jgi:hypothetical protein